MVGIGLLMLGLVAASWWLRFEGRLFETRWFLRACEFVAPLGFIAVLAGWTTTEVGRQPWTVYGLLRTADSVSPSLTGADVLISLVGYIVVYLIMFPAGSPDHGPDRPQRTGDSADGREPSRKRPARPSGPQAVAAASGRPCAMNRRPRFRAGLDARSSASACSSTSCSTASISASACSTASRRIRRRATW